MSGGHRRGLSHAVTALLPTSTDGHLPFWAPGMPPRPLPPLLRAPNRPPAVDPASTPSVLSYLSVNASFRRDSVISLNGRELQLTTEEHSSSLRRDLEFTGLDRRVADRSSKRSFEVSAAAPRWLLAFSTSAEGSCAFLLQHGRCSCAPATYIKPFSQCVAQVPLTASVISFLRRVLGVVDRQTSVH